MPQQLLVPVDFSPDADWALDYALHLAVRLGAGVTLLHVVYTIRMTEVDVTPYLAEVEAQSRQELQVRLQRVREAGLTGEVRLAHGVPFREIVASAVAVGADLIIMGTHGRTGLQHLLLGSVTEKVVRLAPCPVLVTRRPRTPMNSDATSNR